MCVIQDLLFVTLIDHSSVLILLNSSALDLKNKHGTKTYSLCTQFCVQLL